MVNFISDSEPCQGPVGILAHLAVANVYDYLQKNAYVLPCLMIQAST